MEITNGLVFCLIDSWLTGRRLVSLPFSDHCDPLVEKSEDLSALVFELKRDWAREGLRSIEMRPLDSDLWSSESATGFRTVGSYYLHKLDLKPDLDHLFHAFHKGSIQSRIRHADREGLSYEEGRSELLLNKFYQLQLLTRRRHLLPPQPREWFHNLVACLGEQLKFRVASKGGQPIASIVTLRYKSCLVYKYGCSDARFHHLGGVAFLLWKAIQEAREQGLEEFDLGRSDCGNSGLIAFKNHWGATRSTLTYFRFPARLSQPASEGFRMQVAKRVFAHVPDGFLTTAGKLLYRHMG
jgi:lipid II:glycine glycyltransferase (peptidoglycan interpeptide bridge formation enzyme)